MNDKISKSIRATSITLTILLIALPLLWPAFAIPPATGLLDPKTIPKYVNQLIANIPIYTPTDIIVNGIVIEQDYEVHMVSLTEQILPTGTPLTPGSSGLTKVWGYQGLTNIGEFAHSPSASFVATRGVPVYVKWVNDITEPQFLPVDPTLMWADPNNMGTVTQPYNPFPPGYPLAQSPVPLVPHLHGGEVPSISDGGPNEWFTSNGIHGPTYNTNPNKPNPGTNAAWFYYPNEQQAATLWYHDHALGMTRLNVMSGLAGYYILRDPANPTDSYLSGHFTYGVNEIPLAIQDRSFYADGSLWFPTVGINPTVHPYWFPEFFGNTIMVNGKVWPNLDVTPGWYRFRVLDGSNARFYTLSFDNKMPFTVIGTEGGYLMAPFTTTSITIAPGERADILVDFSAIPVGTKIILKNTARAPFPGGAPADPQTVGQIMQFTVKATSATPGALAPTLPTPLNPILTGVWPTLAPTTNKRIMTLFEIPGAAGPLMVTINGQRFSGLVTETPKVGTTEDWIIVNLTPDTHPIHTHLATFQVVSRQSFQVKKYTTDWLALNAPNTPPFTDTYAPVSLDPTPYLQGKAIGALPNEMGWKDTVQMNPGEVTIIRIRFTQQDGTAYTFDPTTGPGYVWHCHIVDHEDNEMMRPYIVTP